MTIALYFSGGASNATPASSIGGVKSSVAVTRRLFGPITEAQFATGVVFYRCVYVYSDASTGVVPWISSETPLAETTVAIGWGSVAGATEPVLVAGNAPSTEFQSPMSPSEGVNGGFLFAGQSRPLWIRYTVSPTSQTPLVENFSLQFDVTGAPTPFRFNVARNSVSIGFL